MENPVEEGYKNHVFGMSAETLFDLQCDARGLKVEKPKGSRCWDREIHAGNGVFRVQIKATNKLAKVNRGKRQIGWVYQVAGRRENVAKSTYAKSGEVHFMAIYVGPQAQWYILPASECNSRHIRIRRNPQGKMFVARGNWSYFEPILNAKGQSLMQFDGLQEPKGEYVA